MDVLSPFIPVLCHSDWLFHGESYPRLDVVHPGRAWPSSPSCTWQSYSNTAKTHFFIQRFGLRSAPFIETEFRFRASVSNRTTFQTIHLCPESHTFLGETEWLSSLKFPTTLALTGLYKGWVWERDRRWYQVLEVVCRVLLRASLWATPTSRTVAANDQHKPSACLFRWGGATADHGTASASTWQSFATTH